MKNKRWLKIVIGVVVVIAIGVVAVPFIYIHFIKSPAPKKLSLDDAPVVTTVAGGTPTTAVITTTAGTGTVGSVTSTPAASTPAVSTPAGGSTALASSSGSTTYTVTSQSTAGYRVTEVLFGQHTEGVGRTNAVTGSVTLSGSTVTAANFAVDMATLKSDQSQRDSKFKGEIMETSKFPTATFTLTKPIDLGSLPADGTEVKATATGDLMLHGVTKSVTFDVTAKKTGTSIAINGSIKVVFADYSIANPSNPAVTTEDNGLIEVLLVATAG